jgi:uncharacterized protein (TIGR02271 family)
MNPERPTDPNETHTRTADAACAQPDFQPEREQAVIPVMQEELAIGTRRVETGSGVRVHKSVEEHEARIDEPLTKEEVEVERVTVDRPVEGPVAVRYEGETMIVPVVEEVLFVEKRLVLKEEIRITRRRRELHAPQRVSLRREHATVERIGEPDPRVTPTDVGSASRDPDSSESLLDEKRRYNEEVLRTLR